MRTNLERRLVAEGGIEREPHGEVDSNLVKVVLENDEARVHGTRVAENGLEDARLLRRGDQAASNPGGERSQRMLSSKE
jgi:hypothetical protein